MNNEDLQKLKVLALAATPGPWLESDWTVDDGSNTTTVEARIPEVLRPGQSSIWPGGIQALRIAECEAGVRPINDAAYIAAANPVAILAMIKRIESLAAPAVANAATGELPPPMAGVRPHTELSRRLRDIICAEPFAKQLTITPRELLAAANEIDRYYGGMMNWKATAEAKDTTAIASLNKPVVAMTGDECHKILKAMALDADEWAEGLSYDPTEQEISKRCVEFILAAHAGQGEKE